MRSDAIVAPLPLMRYFGGFSAFLVCLVGPGVSQGQMHRVSLEDAQFGMSAYTMEVPSGWKFEGSVRHDLGCSPGDAYETYRLTSPDGNTVIGVKAPFFTAYPAQMTQGMDFSQCGVITPAAPTGQLLTRYIVPHIAPGAQVLSPVEVPNVDEWSEQLSSFPAQQGTTRDSSMVKIAYNERGQNWEAWIIGLTVKMQMGQGGAGWSRTMIGTVRAAQGHLQEAEKNLGWALKLQANSDWVNHEMARMNQAAGQIQAQGERTRAGIAADARAHMDQTHRQTQQTIDGIHATGRVSADVARERENARHSGAVDTANYVGDKPTNYYRWRNSVTGEIRVTNNPTNPGPNWVAIDR